MDEAALFASLDEYSLRTLADYYSGLARRCTTKAAELAALREMRQRNESRLERLDHLAELIESHISAGMTADRATEAVALETGTLPETVAKRFARHCRLKQDTERRERDRRILALAARGWNNAKIADHVGMHRVSISRIVRRHLSAPPPEPLAPALAPTKPPILPTRREPLTPSCHQRALLK